jgi:hypothetical protein
MEQSNGLASSDREALIDDLTGITNTTTFTHASSAHTHDKHGPFVSPPYWQTRQRGNSSISDVSRKRLSGPIRLTDNSEEESDQSRACWAKSARVEDYVIISGSMSKAGLGSYVVWNCTVETLNVGVASLVIRHLELMHAQGGSFKIRKRYSEFDKLRNNLVKTFPHAGAALPEIPPKSMVHRFQPKFLEKRKIGLCHFLK